MNTPNLNSKDWLIDRCTYSRMAGWEIQLVDELLQTFNPTLRADANFKPLKAVVSRFNKPNTYISIRVFGRTNGRPELDQKMITVWKGKRVMINLYESHGFISKLASQSA